MSAHYLSVRRQHRKGETTGCTGRCSCTWKGRSTLAPSNGGRVELLEAHRDDTGMRAVLDT